MPEAQRSGNSLSGFRVGFAVFLVNQKHCHYDSQKDGHRHIEVTNLSHLGLRRLDLVNDNSESEKNQCHNNTPQQVHSNKRFMSDDSDDKDCETDFAAVIEKFGYMIERGGFHRL